MLFGQARLTGSVVFLAELLCLHFCSLFALITNWDNKRIIYDLDQLNRPTLDL